MPHLLHFGNNQITLTQSFEKELLAFSELINEKMSEAMDGSILQLPLPPINQTHVKEYINLLIYFLIKIHEQIKIQKKEKFEITTIIRDKLVRYLNRLSQKGENMEYAIPFMVITMDFYKINQLIEPLRSLIIYWLEYTTNNFRKLCKLPERKEDEGNEENLENLENQNLENSRFMTILSTSLFISNKKDGEKASKLKRNYSNPQIPINFFNVNTIKPHKRFLVPDEYTNKCLHNKCAAVLERGKHHCRLCGGIFCEKCSYHWYRILSFKGEDVFRFIPDTIGTISYRDYLNSQQRVCVDCSNDLENHFICEKKYITKALALLNLPVASLVRASRVAETWHQSVLFNLRWIKKLIYASPTPLLSPYKRSDSSNPSRSMPDAPSNVSFDTLHWKWLWLNRKSFVGHLPWLVQLFNYFPFQKEGQVAEFTELLRNSLFPREMRSPCLSRLCTRTCSTDYFVVLSFLSDHCTSFEIRELVLRFVEQKFTDEEIVLFLPFFVKALPLEEDFQQKSPTWAFLQRKASLRVVRESLFFLIRSKRQISSSFYDRYQDLLVFIYGSLNICDELLNLKKFCDIIDSITSFDTEDVIKTKIEKLNSISNISLPIKPNFIITSFLSGWFFSILQKIIFMIFFSTNSKKFWGSQKGFFV